MIKKITASERYRANHDWLDTYHLFSFADYFDPNNLSFGNLRVFNDDTIAGQSGFGAHSHSNMEIVTIVFQGTLNHQDSMGNNGSTKTGEVQYMSAGTGVTHAELNQEDETIRLYQIWMLPKSQGLTPTYNQKDFSNLDKNSLVPVASGFEDVLQNSDAIEIQSNTTIYKSELEADSRINYSLSKERGLFVYVTSGKIQINDQTFGPGDQARIHEESSLAISALENSEFIAIETTLEEM